MHQNLFNSLFKIYLTIFIMIKYFNRKGFFFQNKDGLGLDVDYS